MEWNVELAAGPYEGGTDGPVWDGEALLFALVGQSRIMRYHPGTGQVAVYRKYTGNTIGLTFGPDGQLYGCQSFARRVVRFNVDGSMSMLADRLEGRLHNQPDDLVIDSGGRIWFTDPLPHPRVLEPPIDHASVLRLQRDGAGAWRLERMTYDTVFPTGILLSADERTLYVSENPSDATGRAELRAYPIGDDGALGPGRVLQTFRGPCGVHGMCLDSDGNVVACVGQPGSEQGPAITVFSAGGEVLENHPFKLGQANNCAFGDPDLSVLYVTTAEGHLCRVRDTGWRGSHLLR